MTGRAVVITGPTSGIGKEIARSLARLGANLVLGCRDAAAGKRLADELQKVPGAGSMEVVQVDVASHPSIKEFAAQVLTRYPRFEVLVNNAGVSLGTQPRAESPEGIEITFATNVLGYYRLGLALLPRLKDSSPARVVNVASTFASDLDLDDLQFQRRPWDSMKAYAQSKACDRLLTWALARRLEGTGVTANAMAPGLIVDTGLYRHAAAEVMARLRQRGGRTPADGADTAVWLASAPEVARITGTFFENRKEVSCAFRGREAEEKLWSICESFTR
jgi:NAD(P)-dependent dehydrogenase (short-subunit alcohol dehydrogenase family)